MPKDPRLERLAHLIEHGDADDSWEIARLLGQVDEPVRPHPRLVLAPETPRETASVRLRALLRRIFTRP